LNEDILKLIHKRQSTRTPFNSRRQIEKNDLKQIIEAARWAPTAHNMQNFEIVAVDDPKLLKTIGNIISLISEDFLRENYQQLSFSKKELLKKKVGILGSGFPPSWRDPNRLHAVAQESPPGPLSQTIQGSPLLLIVVFDSRRRAPASEGDFLGILSLGCAMENMWLMAQSLGIGFQVMSVFSNKGVEKEVKRILNIPEYMKIAYAIRLGYSLAKSTKYLRVRRNVETVVHHNQFGNPGLA
jgi:nitroreductase